MYDESLVIHLKVFINQKGTSYITIEKKGRNVRICHEVCALDE